jgi:hypothetical protein
VSVVVKKERRCTECKRKFATPESFRSHKYKFGSCRSLEALALAGFIETGKGWHYTRAQKNEHSDD